MATSRFNSKRVVTCDCFSAQQISWSLSWKQHDCVSEGTSGARSQVGETAGQILAQLAGEMAALVAICD
jgi:hypothetical protein